MIYFTNISLFWANFIFFLPRFCTRIFKSTCKFVWIRDFFVANCFSLLYKFLEHGLAFVKDKDLFLPNFKELTYAQA
jgi:hypothetical protein